MRQELLDCSPYSNDYINVFPIVIYPGSRTCSFLSNILTFRVYSHTYSYSLWSTYKTTCIVQHSLRGIFCFPVFFGFYYSLIVFQLPTNVPLIIRQDLSSEVGAMASNPLRMRTKMKISFPHHNRVFLLLTLRVEGDGGRRFLPWHLMREQPPRLWAAPSLPLRPLAGNTFLLAPPAVALISIGGWSR